MSITTSNFLSTPFSFLIRSGTWSSCDFDWNVRWQSIHESFLCDIFSSYPLCRKSLNTRIFRFKRLMLNLQDVYNVIMFLIFVQVYSIYRINSMLSSDFDNRCLHYEKAKRWLLRVAFSYLDLHTSQGRLNTWNHYRNRPSEVVLVIVQNIWISSEGSEGRHFIINELIRFSYFSSSHKLSRFWFFFLFLTLFLLVSDS